jgi:hypothetical protein
MNDEMCINLSCSVMLFLFALIGETLLSTGTAWSKRLCGGPYTCLQHECASLSKGYRGTLAGMHC